MLASGFPLTAIAQPIESSSPQTSVTTEDGYTRIEGGVQVDENLFHQFDTFNVETGATADFITPDSIQSVIGQVSGGASYIDGVLQVSGSYADLYLINPAGVLFGPNSRLNLGGSLTVTTADQVGFGEDWLNALSTEDYSRFEGAPTAYRFTSETPGAIINQGDLAVSEQRSIRLMGADVVNTGRLSAPAGEITLTAVPGESLVRLSAAGALLKIEVDSALLSPGAALTPLLLPELLTGGELSGASNLRVNSDGSVVLLGSDQTVSPSAFPERSASTVLAAGELDVSGIVGGQLNLVGDNIEIAGASLEASGDMGGGLIRIGGDYQGRETLPTASRILFNEGAIARGDARVEGNGGQVVVWSDGTTRFDGEISARGAGSGSGGQVETSGLERLTVGDRASVMTDSDSGELGTWLLDPADLTVNSAAEGATIPANTNEPASASTISAATVVAALDRTNVDLQANNSLTVEAVVDARENASAGNLSLQAPTVNLNAAIALRSGSTLSGTATAVNVGASGDVQNGIDAVATGGTVSLAAATYTPNSQLSISRNLTLRGQGDEATLLSGSNTHRVLQIDATSAVLDSIGISDGADTVGSGIFVSNGGSLTLTNSTLSNNNSLAPGLMSGGGIRLDGAGASSIVNTTLSGNRAGAQGGGISLTNGHTLTIERSTLSGNTAASGGGISIDGSAGTIINNSTLSGNTASSGNGGALFISSGTTAALTNATVTNNSAQQEGGGIANLVSGNLVLGSSIVAGNAAPTGDDISGVITSAGNNLVQRQAESVGYSLSDLPDGTDPALLPLADNGGPTLTHALRASSPAIDAGTGTDADQRGANANGIRDIGAYERLAPSTLSILSGGGQTAVVLQPYPDPVLVEVVDSVGGSLDGIDVDFSFNPGEGISNGPDRQFLASRVTNASGQTSLSILANSVAGIATLVAETAGGAIDSAPFVKLPDAPESLTILSGNNQSATVNTRFTDELIVQVSDRFGNTIAGETISFAAP
ncbi:MAG: filamentous hemagglutinin N-terminal domain-containing protein, partial [Phormidesmis sp.]